MPPSSPGYRPSSKHWRAAITALLIVTAAFAPTTAATAAFGDNSLEVNLDTPNEVTVGQKATVTATIAVPDLPGSYEQELTLTLSVDGQQTTKKTVTIADGSKTEVTFAHTFESGGTHRVSAQGSISLGGQQFQDSASTSITVGEASDPVETVSVSGPAFTVPDSLTDEVDRYRDRVGAELAPHAFVLASDDKLYVVFTAKQPRKGLASVRGVAVDEQFRADGLTYGVITAQTAAFDTRGSKATVDAIASNPQQFRHDLVRIHATHRQVASLTDPDQGADVTVSSSAGVLLEDPRTVNGMFDRLAARARSLSINSSTDKLDSSARAEIDSLLGTQSRLYTFDFATEFWTSSEATVDGIVLTPGSEARAFVATYNQGGIIPTDSAQPLLYVIQDASRYAEYDSVSALKQQAQDGDLVSVDARLFGETISVQETIEESTACGQEKVEIQTPQGPVCVDVVQDNLVHVGAAWSDVPNSPDDLLFVAGVSSRHLDEPASQLQGRYRIAGEIVATSRIDPSLPDGQVLVISDLERRGSLDDADLAEDVQSMIRSRFEAISTHMRAQIQGSSADTRETPTPTPEVTPTSTPTSTPEDPSTTTKSPDTPATTTSPSSGGSTTTTPPATSPPSTSPSSGASTSASTSSGATTQSPGTTVTTKQAAAPGSTPTTSSPQPSTAPGQGSGPSNGQSDDDGIGSLESLPGFGVTAGLMSMILALLLWRRRR